MLLLIEFLISTNSLVKGHITDTCFTIISSSGLHLSGESSLIEHLILDKDTSLSSIQHSNWKSIVRKVLDGGGLPSKS